MSFVKEIYICREDDVSVKVECGAGGSPISVAHRAARLKKSADYDRCVLVIDADTYNAEAKRKIESTSGLEVVVITPCIEGLFLAILKGDNIDAGISSGECKRQFENRYLDRNQKIEKCKYSSIFTKELLEKARKRNREMIQY